MLLFPPLSYFSITCARLASCYSKHHELTHISAPKDNMQHNTTKISDLIEFAVNVMETRALRLGGVYRRYWFLVTAYCTVKMRLYPDNAKEVDELAAAKVTSVLYKIISAQLPAQETTVQRQLEVDPFVVPSLDDVHNLVFNQTQLVSCCRLCDVESGTRNEC